MCWQAQNPIFATCMMITEEPSLLREGIGDLRTSEYTILAHEKEKENNYLEYS